MQQFVAEKGLGDHLPDEDIDLLQSAIYFEGTDTRIELLYWAITLIQADQVVHDKELAFGRTLASKLSFKEGIVSYYANKPMGDYKSFENEVKLLWLTGL